MNSITSHTLSRSSHYHDAVAFYTRTLVCFCYFQMFCTSSFYCSIWFSGTFPFYNIRQCLERPLFLCFSRTLHAMRLRFSLSHFLFAISHRYILVGTHSLLSAINYFSKPAVFTASSLFPTKRQLSCTFDLKLFLIFQPLFILSLWLCISLSAVLSLLFLALPCLYCRLITLIYEKHAAHVIAPKKIQKVLEPWYT